MSEPTLFDETGAPTHAADPYSSRQAAAGTRRRASGQAIRILERIVGAGPDGITTRQLQRALFTPAEPAWNKVATRCLTLQRKGLVAREDQTRPDENGQHFLVYHATREGIDLIGWDRWPG